MERFSRIIRLIGEDNFNKLKNKKVTVIGAGAVGSYAIEAIARSGINNIRIVDYDKVSISNINRQLVALSSTLGISKVKAAKDRILDINPDCQTETYEIFAHHENFDKIFDNNPDMVVDAIDSLSAKVALVSTAHKMGLNFITSMGAALKIDPSKIKTGDLFDSDGCSLARAMRKRLRRLGINQGVKAVYSTEITDYKFREDDEIKNDIERGRGRRIMGSLPTIAGIFGLTIANYVIFKLIE